MKSNDEIHTVPFTQRFSLTPKEASIYFHIGEKKIRALAAEQCGASFIMGPLSRPRSKILRVAVSRIILSSEASKVKLVGNLVA